MPLITAGLGLITGVALIELGDPCHESVERLPRSGADDRPRRRDRLRAVHRHAFPRELPRLRRRRAARCSTAMDTSGRAVLLAGATVVIALLGMFATGVAFMYGLAIAAVIAVLLTLIASLTLLPALLAGRLGARLVRPRGPASTRSAAGGGRQPAATKPPPRQGGGRGVAGARPCRPGPGRLAIASLALMLALIVPALTLRLDSSDAGNDPARHELAPRVRPARARLRTGIQRPAAARRRIAESARIRLSSRPCVPRSDRHPRVSSL